MKKNKGKKEQIKSIIQKLRLKQIWNSNLLKRLCFFLTIANSINLCGRLVNFSFVDIYGPLVMFRSDSIHTDFKTNFKSRRLPCRLNQLILIQEILVPAINLGATISIFIFVVIIIYKIYQDKKSKKIQNLRNRNIPIFRDILELLTNYH